MTTLSRDPLEKTQPIGNLKTLQKIPKLTPMIVWILEPIGKTVTVYRSETDIKLLTRKDTLTGEDVVEGFSCPIAQLFE